MSKLRAKYGIDDYSWAAFQELLADAQDELLLFLETLAPDFEKHPERVRLEARIAGLTSLIDAAISWLDGLHPNSAEALANLYKAREREAE